MIVLFTDFGLQSPYLGQIKAKLYQFAPSVPVIDLFSDLPKYDSLAAAYLLAAYQRGIPKNSVFLCVVDPGVGDEKRKAVVLKTEEQWFVGPENDLFNVVAAEKGVQSYWEIIWRPRILSASFHGRDLFAPVAAKLATQSAHENLLKPRVVPELFATTPINLEQIIYIDHFGNLITGIRAGHIEPSARLVVQQQSIGYARTFSSVTKGNCFWYENANGLLEIAVNQGSAHASLNVTVGEKVSYITKLE